MDLVMLFGHHRFQRAPDGRIFSPKNFGYSLFGKRYLQVFDSVRILARVVDAPADVHFEEATEGPRVTVHSLGAWSGALASVLHSGDMRRRVDEMIAGDAAVIAIAPSTIASIACPRMVRQGRPYGLEVVTDPYDVFAPGAMKHPLQPYLRWRVTRDLRWECAHAEAVCYVTREALQRRYPCPNYSAGVSDVETPAEVFVAEPRAPRTDGPCTLIMVGTLAQLYKAPDVLIDAVAQVVGGGVDVRLEFVGDGRHLPELRERAARLGVGDHVVFRGALPAGAAVREALDAADVFVLPSHQEGLPRAMVEAMARGLPVIGSTVGGIPELLEKEDMVPPGNVNVLAAKIREVVTDSARRARMSARNLAVAGEYREDLLQERRLAFYRHLRDATAAWMARNRR